MALFLLHIAVIKKLVVVKLPIPAM